MLLKLHIIRTRDAKEIVEDIWINTDIIGKIERCHSDKTRTQSWISLKDDYTWRTIGVAETPEQIELLTSMC